MTAMKWITWIEKPEEHVALLVVAQVEARENNVNAMILSKDCAVDNDGTALYRNNDHDNKRDRIKYIEKMARSIILKREKISKDKYHYNLFSVFKVVCNPHILLAKYY